MISVPPLTVARHCLATAVGGKKINQSALVATTVRSRVELGEKKRVLRRYFVQRRRPTRVVLLGSQLEKFLSPPWLFTPVRLHFRMCLFARPLVCSWRDSIVFPSPRHMVAFDRSIFWVAWYLAGLAIPFNSLPLHMVACKTHRSIPASLVAE